MAQENLGFRVIPLNNGAQQGPDDFLSDPQPPEWMTEWGTAAWNDLAPLHKLRLTDLPEFAAFCEAVAEFRESSELIRDTGLVVIDPVSGAPVPNPVTSIRDRADRKIASWANRFHQ